MQRIKSWLPNNCPPPYFPDITNIGPLRLGGLYLASTFMPNGGVYKLTILEGLNPFPPWVFGMCWWMGKVERGVDIVGLVNAIGSLTTAHVMQVCASS